MALKVHDNGFVEITSKKDALDALVKFRELQEAIREIREENDLDEMEKDAAAYKVAAQKFLVDSEIDHIEGDGWHGTIVKGAASSHWIATEDDIPEDVVGERDVMPLQQIIEEKTNSKISEKGSKARKLWNKMTRRVIDPAAIEELVQEGKLKVDEISPAWYETQRAPYLRIFEDGD